VRPSADTIAWRDEITRFRRHVVKYIGDGVMALFGWPEAMVGFIEPMLALAVTKLPEGAAWSYELKFDGSGAVRVERATFDLYAL
jgi:hypothetical protein